MRASDFRSPQGFEDRRPDQPQNRRTPAELLGAKAPLTGGQRAALWRIVRGTPQAVVIVPTGLKTATQLRAHLNYISRHGTLPVHDEAGIPQPGPEGVGEMVEAWRAIDGLDSRRRSDAPLARRIVLSGPAGAAPDKVEAAARAHLAYMHPEHPYVRVTHTDTPHPHVHVVLRALGRNRRRLTPQTRDLERYRENFAQALRQVGIEADASPRWLRGLAGRGLEPGQWRTARRFELDGGERPRWLEHQVSEASQIAFAATPDLDREMRVLTSQGRIRRAFLDLASRLSGSPELEDRRLGLAIQGYVRELPPPETERLAISRQMRARIADLGESQPIPPRRERLR